MILRAVFVTIAPGQTDAYWAWAAEILALWEQHGIRRHGGPFRGKGPNGEDTGLWLTLHDSEQTAIDEFREMYAAPDSRALLDRRSKLVTDTTLETYSPFEG